MKTIKFWDIPNEIKELTFDCDKTDLRLHCDDMYRWGARLKRDYLKAQKEIDDIKYEGKGWEIYAWYDISSFNYWMKDMQETNYIQITIAFDSEDIEESEVKNIYRGLDNAKDKAESIQERYSYDPSPYNV